MKKVFLFATLIALAITASAQRPTEEMMRQFRSTVQKRDISMRHLESNIPLGESVMPPAKATKEMPSGRVWFPGEWEEVQAIVVTPYYEYSPDTNLGAGYWAADPLVTGVAQYYKYSGGQWQEKGMGPYKAEMDTSSTFSKVSFYLMDAIQLGGAEAWVRIEQMSDSSLVLRRLERMNLRHDNVRFIIGPGNSFWYRDCGPICFYHGDNDDVAMLDFTYYPGRALDDSLPTLIYQQMGIPNYITRIEWEGGNCLVDGAGMVFSSDAIYSNNNDRYGQLTWDGKNPNTINYSQVTPLSAAQVRQGLRQLLGQRATHILPAYRYDGGTGHIDLYADMWDENGFVFSVMPDNYSSWVDYQTGMKNIDSLCSYNSIFDRDYYTMGTLPFPKKDNGSNFNSQTEYNNNYTRTYSNHTFVNNVILQPCFSTVGADGKPTAEWDRSNLEAIQQAYPGYTIYCVDVREFDGTGGAIHCITKQIPAENPIRILHKNIYGFIDAMQGHDVPVSAIITNKSGISHAEVMYRFNGGDWHTLNLNANGNRFYGILPTSAYDTIYSEYNTATVEYYISATSNNGKTITKPMTAPQGGYYNFFYHNSLDTLAVVDSSFFDFDTTAMDMDLITFELGTSWLVEDTTQPRTVSIETPDTPEQLFSQFYPNPANNQANIDIDLLDGTTYRVDIIDIMGRLIHSSTLSDAGLIRYTINTQKLASGIYNVVFSSKSQRIVRRLVVK